jgi:hypothetical protein
MGTISDKLMRIINTKEDIRQALISKGYDVPTSIPFKEYAKMILDLPCKVDSFPDIEGIVARYSASGLTNEQMAANPVWVDKTGNGHDLQLKNFSWKGMSGVGGYGDENHQTFYKFTLDDYVFIAIPPGAKHMNFTFRVTGLQPGNKLTLAFFGTTNTVYGTWNKDGIYTVDADIVEAGKPTYFYNGYGATRGEFTIEILPLYPGALVFDGVDDYGTCDNFPILTKEKGYTVVALRQWITRGEGTLGLISNVKNWLKDGAFVLEFRDTIVNRSNNPISFGAVGSEMDLPHILTYQTSKSYNGVSITTGSFKGTDVLHVGKLAMTGFGGNYANAAIWELVFLDHDATEEELTKIKDYFVKTYPWLFPDQAWTVTGKTNEDEDRATIANITGNGNDLVLSNFGFAEGSGYGLYAQNYISYAITNRAVYTKTNSSIHVTKSITAGVNFTESARDVTIPSYRIKVTGIQSGQEMIYRGSNNTFLTNIPSDGIYVLPAVENGSNLGFQFVSYTGDCDITIEQIPEYEGYLITDGVDDKVQSYSFTMNEDWTIVGDWELLSNVQINCGIVKAQNVYLYNTANGLLISINNPRSLQSFGTKSLHAICSDGRLYDRNWVEYEYTVDQNFAIVESSLNIGFNLNNYTQIAFKNLGIYNNQILYKDDCIKAYNYLQTLKAK